MKQKGSSVDDGRAPAEWTQNLKSQRLDVKGDKSWERPISSSGQSRSVSANDDIDVRIGRPITLLFINHL